MNKVVRSANYSVEQWLVVDDTGNQTCSFNCWQDANNYAIKLNSKGIKSTNGTDIIAENGTTTNKNSMKTIEEAAIEYTESKIKYEYDPGYSEDICKSFMKGVEFAQLFIQYSEQEPPQGETVLVKLNNGNVFTAKYVKSAKEERFNAWHDGHSFYQCVNTHWRPINLK